MSVLVYIARRNADIWEYLLLRRVARPDLGLGCFWQGVTGGLENGEDTVQAVTREVLEETGLTPSALAPVGYSYSYPIRDEWRNEYPPDADRIVEHVFAAVVGEQQNPVLSGEHDAWRWCGLAEALGLLSYPDNIEALRRCAELVDSGSGR